VQDHIHTEHLWRCTIAIVLGWLPRFYSPSFILLLARPFKVETFWCTQKHGKVWNSCLQGSWGVHYKNMSCIGQGLTWPSPCQLPCVSNWVICWILIILMDTI
jgi:hypothetical protein